MSAEFVHIRTTRELLDVIAKLGPDSLVVDSVGTARCILQSEEGLPFVAVIDRGAWMSPDVPKTLRRVFTALERVSQMHDGARGLVTQADEV